MGEAPPLSPRRCRGRATCFVRAIMRVACHLARSDHEVLVSGASLWEITIKTALGKLNLPVSLQTLVEKQRDENHVASRRRRQSSRGRRGTSYRERGRIIPSAQIDCGGWRVGVDDRGAADELAPMRPSAPSTTPAALTR